jgi:hypothetical protein
MLLEQVCYICWLTYEIPLLLRLEESGRQNAQEEPKVGSLERLLRLLAHLNEQLKIDIPCNMVILASLTYSVEFDIMPEQAI